jgi:catechol 2,3-dioxygenase-like lactoylglutathione lyase family enzyme
MLDNAELIAFLPTTDSGRARRFFAETLGLRLVEESPYALVFDAGGTMLRITPVDAMPSAGFTVLGWRVTDIEASTSALTTRGVEFIRYAGMRQDALGIWTTPGNDRVAWFLDPDGNTLSLTEFASDRG